MRSSTRAPKYKFLIDENVRKDLYTFLQKRNIDVKRVPKRSSDHRVQELSLTEKRTLITNDEDFSLSSEDEIYAVIWLKITQHDKETLLASFEKLLNECKGYAGNLIVLSKGKWTAFPLIVKKMKA